MKAIKGSVVLVLAFAGVFALEIVTHSVGNDVALLKLGALPDNGELNGQYWRFATYSFLHFNWAHLLVNALLILWVGRILEKRIGTALTGAIYVCSVLSSAAVILLVHSWYPKMGATVGASGGMFGLVGATLVFSNAMPGFSVKRVVRAGGSGSPSLSDWPFRFFPGLVWLVTSAVLSVGRS
jgi:membrane associated rhomboid family serine protease